MRKKDQRLPLMIEMLTRPGGASINEMCEKLEVKRQQIYDYIRELEELHFPLTQKDDYNGPTNSQRWYIPEGDRYRSFAIKLTPSERMLLRSLLNTDSLYKNSALTQKLGDLKSKVNAVTLYDPRKRVDTAFTSIKGAKDYSGKEDIIDTLLTAIEGSTVCTVTYLAAQAAEAKTYDIEPYTWVNHDNGLYCIAAMPAHNRDIRVLAVERFQRVIRHSDRGFAIPADYNPASYLSQSFGIFIEQPVQVRVRFERDAALYARERTWGTGQSVEELADGAIILSFTAAGLLELKRWALSYGSSALVLEPPELASAVSAECAAMAARYAAGRAAP